LSNLANTQTDRQTNKVWQKHYLLGRGKNLYMSPNIGLAAAKPPDRMLRPCNTLT